MLCAFMSSALEIGSNSNLSKVMWKFGTWNMTFWSYDPLITWFCEIKWQIKTIISPLPQYLWTPNVIRWWINFSGSYPQSYLIFQSLSIVRSRDKLKSFYLHYQSACCQQTGRVVTFIDWLLTAKSHYSVVAWSCKITWQVETYHNAYGY